MPPGGRPLDATASNNLTVSERARRRAREGASDPVAREAEQTQPIERVALDRESAEQRRARRRARQEGGSAVPRTRTPLAVAEDALVSMLGG